MSKCCMCHKFFFQSYFFTELSKLISKSKLALINQIFGWLKLVSIDFSKYVSVTLNSHDKNQRKVLSKKTSLKLSLITSTNFYRLIKVLFYITSHDNCSHHFVALLKSQQLWTFCFQNFFDITHQCLPYYLKQTFLPIIWIFTESEGDGIESRLSF